MHQSPLFIPFQEVKGLKGSGTVVIDLTEVWPRLRSKQRFSTCVGYKSGR